MSASEPYGQAEAEALVRRAGERARAGHTAEAERLLRKALAARPGLLAAHVKLGVLLGRAGRLAEEQQQYAEALAGAPRQDDPALAVVHNNLGRTYRRQGRMEQAEAMFRRALVLRPTLAEAHYELAELLAALGRDGEAEAEYRAALAHKRTLAPAHSNLGRLLERRGDLRGAEEGFRAALACREHPQPLHWLANLLLRQGRAAEATACFRRITELQPGSATALADLGALLGEQGLAEEEEVLRRALGLEPDLAAAHANLGNALKRQGRLAEAEASYRRALELQPTLAEAASNYGGLLQGQGRLEEAEQQYRRAVELRPGFAAAWSNLLFTLSHRSGVTAEALFAEHKAFGQRFETAPHAAHANTPDPDRRLVLGFVTGDFQKHPVTFFLQPIFESFSRASGFALQAFHTRTHEDEVTRRIRPLFERWHTVAHLGDEQLDALIRAEGIDILFDLSGHTGGNRLLAFARKPAPVQVSWVAYLGTTGLRAMDLYLADEVMLPRAVFAAQFTEELAYLPVAAPFRPSEEAPPLAPLPALRNGWLTLGSFNRGAKITARTLEVWAVVLRAMPAARLLVANLRSQAEADRIGAGLAGYGIARERLEAHRACPEGEFLALHNRVDLCLDTVPYTGHTTTLQALWMGVPTLTLPGQTPPSRQSASVLAHTGLRAFVAEDAQDLAARARDWGGRLEELAQMRATMRERLEASPYRQPAVVAAALERVLREAWQRWCATGSALPSKFPSSL